MLISMCSQTMAAEILKSVARLGSLDETKLKLVKRAKIGLDDDACLNVCNRQLSCTSPSCDRIHGERCEWSIPSKSGPKVCMFQLVGACEPGKTKSCSYFHMSRIRPLSEDQQTLMYNFLRIRKNLKTGDKAPVLISRSTTTTQASTGPTSSGNGLSRLPPRSPSKPMYLATHSGTHSIDTKTSVDAKKTAHNTRLVSGQAKPAPSTIKDTDQSKATKIVTPEAKSIKVTTKASVAPEATAKTTPETKAKHNQKIKDDEALQLAISNVALLDPLFAPVPPAPVPTTRAQPKTTVSVLDVALSAAFDAALALALATAQKMALTQSNMVSTSTAAGVTQAVSKSAVVVTPNATATSELKVEPKNQLVKHEGVSLIRQLIMDGNSSSHFRRHPSVMLQPPQKHFVSVCPQMFSRVLSNKVEFVQLSPRAQSIALQVFRQNNHECSDLLLRVHDFNS